MGGVVERSSRTSPTRDPLIRSWRTFSRRVTDEQLGEGELAGDRGDLPCPDMLEEFGEECLMLRKASTAYTNTFVSRQTGLTPELGYSSHASRS